MNLQINQQHISIKQLAYINVGYQRKRSLSLQVEKVFSQSALNQNGRKKMKLIE